jgi:hypothetical protein
MAAKVLGIPVKATRHTPALKQWLTERSQEYPHLPNYSHQPYQPLTIDRPPPTPLPEQLWGEHWRFATLAADQLESLAGRMIPVLDLPENFLPLHFGIASTVAIPGVVIDGGRRSLQLARWLESVTPVSLDYIPGDPDGLILEAGLNERWIMSTFSDAEVKAAAQTYATRRQLAKGLHFLLVQPDDSGMTYSGFWLLKHEDSSNLLDS